MCHPVRYRHKPCGHIGAYAGTQECPHIFEIEELQSRRVPESSYMYTILRALCRHFSDTIYVELKEPCAACKFAGIQFPETEDEPAEEDDNQRTPRPEGSGQQE